LQKKRLRPTSRKEEQNHDKYIQSNCKEKKKSIRKQQNFQHPSPNIGPSVKLKRMEKFLTILDKRVKCLRTI
jgi:hypothetical protein